MPSLHHRISTIFITLAVASASCVRLDEAHCIVNGGDFACDEERLCAMAIASANELSDEGDGCVNERGLDERFDRWMVHVRYGLPESLGARAERAEDDPRSVAGVLQLSLLDRRLEDVCVVDESVVRTLEPQWIEVDAVRAFLARRGRVSVESAELEPHHVEAIRAFVDSVDEWLEACEAVAMASEGD